MDKQNLNDHGDMKGRDFIFLHMRFVFLIACALIVAPAPGQRVDQFSLVNSPLDEQNPILSPDGKYLFFTISNHSQNVGGKEDLGDIWYAPLTPSGWGPALHGGSAINNTLHNTVAGFSHDGSQLFLMGHYSQNGKSVGSQGLSVSALGENGWTVPINISIPYFKNKTPFQSGCLSADGKVLVFSAISYTTFGAEDIYITVKSADKWSEPKNLGPIVNSALQDVSPSLSSDGTRLFFATNGRKGYGSFDIFYCDRLDDTWLHWSEPTNMGTSVNSEGRELFYRSFPAGGFYTSTSNSDVYGDLRFQAPDVPPVTLLPVDTMKVVRPDTVAKPAITEVNYEKSPGDRGVVTHLWGKVTDARTHLPLQAAIHFISAEKREAHSGVDGRYEAELPGVAAYHVKVEAPGYLGEFETLDLRTQVLKDLELNFNLSPVEVGAKVNLRSVLFEQSKPVLLPESYDELDMVADFMRENPAVEIELAGHTDNRGRHDANMKLSRERVEKVKEYLVSKGIDARRMTGRGYGGTRPIADNDVDETRRLNRRVEFIILKN